MNKQYYDLIKDWNAIESSFMFDYNIDLIKEVMSARRFKALLANLSNESAIGRIVIGKMNKENYKPDGTRRPKMNWVKNGTKDVLKLKRFN